MFLDFFYLLRSEGIPVSLHEYLNLLEALKQDIIGMNLEDFYFLCRSIMIKSETNLDRFDQLFAHYFKGLEYVPEELIFKIPDEWLQRSLENLLSEKERAMIEAMGGLEALRKRFEELLKEQKERHEGGNRWIGTGGSSPFGAYGYNPEGYRIGQVGSGNRKAVKVWDQRDFANLDDKVELNTRNLKMALRRLRVFTREGIAEELDIDDTIQRTCNNAGLLDISLVPTKKNRVKVLMFMDVGGSMDDHVEICSRLFSSARYEFKYLRFYYFHNCIYETVWKDSSRRNERIPTLEILNKYNRDYKVIFVGDAAMSPYELLSPSGSVEHYNDETGATWLKRVINNFNDLVWINPNPEEGWEYYETTHLIRNLMDQKMFPMTVNGITKAMQSLKK